MNFDDVIQHRFSCRTFEQDDIPYKKVEQVLEAGRLAPSAGNLQPWRFIVIQDAEIIKKIAGLCLKQYWMNSCPVLIVICSDNKNSKRHFGMRGEFYTIQDCAAATQNMLLKATELGLGCNWVGAFDEDGLRNVCNIDDDIRPQAIITLGITKQKTPQKERYPLDLVTYYDTYGTTKQTGTKPTLEHAKELTAKKAEKKKKKLFSFLKKKSSPEKNTERFNSNKQ